MEQRRALGIVGENLALQHLQGQNYKLLARNYRCRIGELDIVMLDGQQVVFVEVRAKSSRLFGSGFDSITLQKRTKLRMVAQHFLAYSGLDYDAAVRFDVISIDNPLGGPVSLQHLKGAF